MCPVYPSGNGCSIERAWRAISFARSLREYTRYGSPSPNDVVNLSFARAAAYEPERSCLL